MDACLGPGLRLQSVAASSEGKNPDKQLVSLSPGCHIASLPACFLGVAPLLLLPLLACMHVCSSVPGILWARILEHVAMPSSRESFRPKDKPASLMSPALAAEFFTTSTTWEALFLLGCVCAKSLQPCPTPYNPMDCSPPGSSVHGVLQARILEWVAMSSSRESSWPRDWTHVSYISCIERRVLYH